jgi:hypothetical protein
VAQQRAQVADRLGRDPRLRQQTLARSSCARVCASTLSFFSLAEAIALQREGWTRCGWSWSPSSSSTSQPHP